MTQNQINNLEKHFKEILEIIGEDPTREGLVETPLRVAKAYMEWFKGYEEGPKYKLFTTEYAGMVIKKNIPFTSFCEHHIAMYRGFINFGYIPNGKVTGISKIIRRFQHISSKLTIQENLTEELINDFETQVKPKGSIIIIEALHSCEGSRGVKVPNVPTITSSVRGCFLKPEAGKTPKEEFLKIIGK